MEGSQQQYQYLMADEYFLENNENYTAFKHEDIQFLVNLSDYDAPIFQPSKIHNPYASLIGNYCISDSSITFINKVDPIFVAIKVLRNKFENEQQKHIVEFENIFNNEDSFEHYLSKCKQIRDNIDCICTTKLINNELYVKLDKQKLFQFLDVKYNNIQNYTQQGAYVVSDCNQKKQQQFEVETCRLFQQYIGQQLYSEYQATKIVIVENRPEILDFQNEKEDRQQGQNAKLNASKKKSQQPKIKQSEQKTLDAGKNCQKMETFFINKTQQNK
ncbi:unnamed protein product [Paramecium sonneborni]|uniref:Uncharacterized protein n=1 Tax=Paramecium sonneborni TaxID=65129 RepID=A0A8S1QL25_9CILI|nr:unnamed protein product [Paramecium sonneborni]